MGAEAEQAPQLGVCKAASAVFLRRERLESASPNIARLAEPRRQVIRDGDGYVHARQGSSGPMQEQQVVAARFGDDWVRFWPERGIRCVFDDLCRAILYCMKT